MNWRPVEEPPKARVTITALIAFRELGDEFVMLGLAAYRGGRWLHDDTMRELAFKEGHEYWWCAETEILQEVERQARTGAQEKAG